MTIETRPLSPAGRDHVTASSLIVQSFRTQRSGASGICGIVD
ncbi:hypothetical protein ACIF8T_39875 [Streptomyces sp. NPDC085946]